ncbi:MAG: F-box protein [Chlamydiota bacterium]
MVTPISSRLPLHIVDEFTPSELHLLQEINQLDQEISFGDPTSLRSKAQNLLQQILQLPTPSSGSSGIRPQIEFLKTKINELLSQCLPISQNPIASAPSSIPYSQPFLTQLPEDLTHYIFQFVPPEHIGAIQGTCHKFKNQIDNMLTQYLSSCKQSLALSKENVETITSSPLSNDPYANIRPEDRDLPFQEFLKETQIAYQKAFPGKFPSIRAQVSLLERELQIQPKRRECGINLSNEILEIDKPHAHYYTREYFTNLLQSIDRFNTWIGFENSTLIIDSAFIKLCSMLPKIISTKDPLPLECFLHNVKKNYDHFTTNSPAGIVIPEEVSEQTSEIMKTLSAWNPPELVSLAQELHDFLCTLTQLTPLEPFFHNLEISKPNLSSLFDPALSSLVEQNQPLFLSLLYGITQDYKVYASQKYKKGDPEFEANKTLDNLLTYIQKRIPTGFPYITIVEAFHKLGSFNKTLILNVFPKTRMLELLDDNAPYHILEERYLIANDASNPYETLRIAFDPSNPSLDSRSWVLNFIAVFSNPYLDLTMHSLLILFWLKITDCSGSAASLSLLATQPNRTFILLDSMKKISPFNYIFHIPFLQPHLEHLYFDNIPQLPPTFRYLGKSLTHIDCNRNIDLPLSFATSQSPAIQKRFHQEAKRRRIQTIQRIAYRTIKEIGSLALSAAIVYFFKDLIK